MKQRIRDAFYFIQGWVRYFMYYRPYLSIFLRAHIREQIEFRINSMKKSCYMDGSCVICGCSTTALQMCNKSCEGDCYPSMMSKAQWKFVIHTQCFNLFEDKNIYWKANLSQRKFIKIETKDVEEI